MGTICILLQQHEICIQYFFSNIWYEFFIWSHQILPFLSFYPSSEFNFENWVLQIEVLPNFFVHFLGGSNAPLTMVMFKVDGTVSQWMVQCQKDVNQNFRLRLEYAHLLYIKFIMNRINSELIKMGRILMSSSVTESSCDDSY